VSHEMRFGHVLFDKSLESRERSRVEHHAQSPQPHKIKVNDTTFGTLSRYHHMPPREPVMNEQMDSRSCATTTSPDTESHALNVRQHNDTRLRENKRSECKVKLALVKWAGAGRVSRLPKLEGIGDGPRYAARADCLSLFRVF